LPKDRSEPAPNLPTVKAMAPNAPIGAAHITMATMRKNICAAVPIRSVSGLPACPIALRAKPHSTETNSTCSTLPSANAPMNVLGMMPSRNSVVVRLWVCAR
jgi:hypothetical protein